MLKFNQNETTLFCQGVYIVHVMGGNGIIILILNNDLQKYIPLVKYCSN